MEQSETRSPWRQSDNAGGSESQGPRTKLIKMQRGPLEEPGEKSSQCWNPGGGILGRVTLHLSLFAQ